MKSVLIAALLVLSTSMMSFAQVYVNNTNGDDLVGQGTELSPYKTITKAVTVASAGTTIYVASDLYDEAVTINKALTLVATPFNGLTTVTIDDGLTINTTVATDIVNLGITGEKFNLGTSDNALVLTKGNLRITTSRVVIGANGRITRSAGTLDNAPTVSNARVLYISTENVTAGGETPANIGTGTLVINITGTKTVTFPNSVATTGGITVTTGNATFNGNLTLGNGVITNNSTGTVTVNGNISWSASANMGTVLNNANNGNVSVTGIVNFTKLTTGASNHTASIINAGTGTLTLGQGFTLTPGTVSGNSYTILVDASNNSTGTLVFNGPVGMRDLTNVNGLVGAPNAGLVKLAGGIVAGTVTNSDAGTIELTANTTFSGAAVNNANSIIKLNANTITFSNNAAAITNTGGKIISALATEVGSGTVSVTGNTVTVDDGEVPNITVASGKTLNTDATKVWGSITNNGTLNIDADVVVEGSLTTAGTKVDLDADIELKGNYSQTAGVLDLGAAEFVIRGNWVRSSNVPDDVVYTTGILTFTGGSLQTFTPGASLKLYEVVIDKSAGKVTLTQSLEVYHNS